MSKFGLKICRKLASKQFQYSRHIFVEQTFQIWSCPKKETNKQKHLARPLKNLLTFFFSFFLGKGKGSLTFCENKLPRALFLTFYLAIRFQTTEIGRLHFLEENFFLEKKLLWSKHTRDFRHDTNLVMPLPWTTFVEDNIPKLGPM